MNTLDRLMAFLFGDGGIENPNALHPEWTGSNCRMRFTHGPKQESYLKWKVSELEKLGFKCSRFEVKDVRYNKAGSKHDGKIYRSVQASFSSHRLFTEAYKLAYPQGIKGKAYAANWVNSQTVDNYAMAVWWMDDGNLHYRKKMPSDKICGYLNTCTDDQEAHLLKDLFEKKLNSEIRIHRKKDNLILYFPNSTLRKFFFKIAPWIHETMWYKCSIIRGEDGNPIIPNSAEQLINQLKI